MVNKKGSGEYDEKDGSLAIWLVIKAGRSLFALAVNCREAAYLNIEFPMSVRKVTTDSKVAENLGKIALEYGPFVYAFEQVDQKTDLDYLSIAQAESFSPKMENELLGGVVTLSNENAKAVPYYSWSNRGVGKMKVWLPIKRND